MKFSVKIILGLVAFVSLCLVYYLDNYFSQKKEEKMQEAAKALYFKSPDVLQFTLINPNGKFVFAQDKNSDDWKMLEPQQMIADQEAVENALSSLSQINVQQELAGTESAVKNGKSELSQFGLENSKTTISLTLNKNKVITLELGNSVDIGGKSGQTENPISLYALNLNRPQVLVIDANNAYSFVSKSFSDFRTKRLANFHTNDVSSISINSKSGNIALEKKQDKWNLVSPMKAAGDDKFISTFIQTYQNLRALNVIEKNEVAHVGLGKYDLQVPAAVVKFSNDKGKVLQEFDIGITKEAVFMLMPGSAVAQFNLVSWPDYVPQAAKFQLQQAKHVKTTKN
jgi:hypothetical protein